MSTRPALTFAALAVAAGLAAGRGDSIPLRAAAGWAALAFGLVALAYAGGGPALLGKRADGRRRPWAWPLLGPYFLLNALGLALFRWGERGPPLATVAPNLALGRRLTAREARRLGPGWVAVLDLAAEFAAVDPLRAAPGYRSLPVLDATAPGPADLADAVAWLGERTRLGPVYVHCALRHGRSATVAAAYLLATDPALTPEAAEAAVRAARPGVRLNRDQRARLGSYAASLRDGLQRPGT